MRTLRSLALTIMAGTAALTLAACGGSTEASSVAAKIPELTADQQVDITFESYNLAQAGVWTETVKGLIADFEKEYPNIHVTAQAPQGGGAVGSNTVSSVQTQLLAGKAPDVAQLTFDSLDFAATQLGANAISELVGQDAVDAHLDGAHPFHEKAKTLANWNGKTYGIPYVFSTPVLFYNATQLEAAGLPADVDLSTWDKVLTVAKAVTAKTGKPSLDISCSVKGGNWCMQGVFKSNGAEVLSDDRKTIGFGSDAAADTVAKLADLYKAGVLRNSDSSSMYEGFAKGETALQLTTSAMQGMFMSSAAKSGWQLKAASMPGFGDKPSVPTNSGSALFILGQDPAKQRASWELIKFMTSDHAYEQISSKIGYLPLRTSLTQQGGALYDWAQKNPLLAPNLAQLDRLQPWVSYPGNSYVQVDDILATAIEDVVYYGKDAKTTMAEAQRRAQDLLPR
ncbi:ABC transporter substrate-binding protein [Arthrobacter sp. FW306-06-A]|uniref:ABC transporter substrate-binding protein n=1 Tax=Arthrobacter sp. FW306-06-A TaxID=2879621 RepID=UPI001F165614|nr:ABC transporter substrate-binding protein [Arthrobacter sp. FW306-06-A]UKA73413.1 ABC transporter substrate-binding protein [Arthrobacter sp. FW306-06-A]